MTKTPRQEYLKKWRAANREKIQARRKKSPSYNKPTPKMKENRKRKYDAKRRLLDVVKLHYGCTNPECLWGGLYSTSMLDFHHVDPATKKFSVGSQSQSTGVLCEELNKCCVICSNCHREVTWGNLDASGFQKCNLTSDGEIVEISR